MEERKLTTKVLFSCQKDFAKGDTILTESRNEAVLHIVRLSIKTDCFLIKTDCLKEKTPTEKIIYSCSFGKLSQACHRGSYQPPFMFTTVHPPEYEFVAARGLKNHNFTFTETGTYCCPM